MRVPRYHRIFLVLRERILDGSYPEGTLVPGELELARTFGVSRITSKRALDELVAADLVVREQGRGTRVRTGVFAEQLDGAIESMHASNRAIGSTRVALLAFDYCPAAPDVARALRLAPRDRVQRSVRVRFRGDDPFCHVTAHIPAEIGRSFTDEELEHQPMVALLERAGVVIGRAQETISATVAGPEVAGALDVEVGAPLLKVIRTVQDDSDVPVEHCVVLFRPDRYRLVLSLRRSFAETPASAVGDPDADLLRISA